MNIKNKIINVVFEERQTMAEKLFASVPIMVITNAYIEMVLRLIIVKISLVEEQNVFLKIYCIFENYNNILYVSNTR
ncbi:hypothetical protein BpHYR1_021849 [Brachionus plicatilis]|uniref:Uncharacterized protein n=1 Tax=Brachionus plicatilis TaxID=10195 RepID=A0A3M7T4C0_BRAPC|nr:hypothetical protein BpHYR1_021849 [Brachionus plicatilis]